MHAAIGLALRQLTQAQADVGALDLKAPSLVGQVGTRHFQCFGGQLTGLRQAALRALFDRRATGEQGARTRAAKAVAAVGVAQHNAHLRHGHPKHIDHQLRQRGGDALAHGGHGAEHLDHPISGDGDGDVFFQGVAAGPLQKCGQPQTAPFAARLRSCLALGKAIPLRQRQAFVHDVLKRTHVIGLAHGVFVGHQAGRNHVAPAQGHAVHADLARRLVHQALHVEDRFGPARTPVSAHGGGVGQHGGEMKVNGLDVVHAGLHPRANHHLNGHARGRRVGAHIGQGVDAQGQNFAVSSQGHFGLGFDVPPMGGAQKVFRALGHPLDRALQHMAAIRHHAVLGVHAGFHAKATAHVTHQDPHFFFGQTEQIAHQGAHTAGHLAAHAHGQSALVDVGQHAARLQGQGGQALVVNVQFDHMRGTGKSLLRGLCVAITRLGHDVVGHVVTQPGGICGQSRVHAGGVGQFFVVDHHRLGGIARIFHAVGHHHRNHFADKTHPLMGHQVARWAGRRRTIGTFEASGFGQGLDARLGQICAGDHQRHAGHGARSGHIDAFQHRMGVDRAHKPDVLHALNIGVIGEQALAFEQQVVFQPLDRMTASKSHVFRIHINPFACRFTGAPV